jgi:transposase
VSLGRLVVVAVKVEGRSKSEVARDYGVSRRWVHELVARFEVEGEGGLEPRSRRPRRSPQQTPAGLEDEIVGLRKQLAEEGLDAGAHTIAFHLERRHGSAPAPSTIWRILRRRGFITAQPQKRPKSSSAFRPSSPTRGGRRTSPAGSWPTAARWRSSTSSTTTPGCWSPPTPTSPSEPPT